jgi:SAM-dependent methyltransferase
MLPLVTRAADLFDKSSEYERMLEVGIRLSGESREWFMMERVRDLQNRLPIGFRPRRVLDFGCGFGSTAAYLAELYPDAEVVGVDTAEGAIAHARDVHGTDRVRVSGVGDLTDGDGFDLCYTNGVFHHIPPAVRTDAVRLIHRALAPGGRFALMENNPWNPGTRLVMSRIEFDRDAIMLWPGEARRLLAAGGFLETSAPRFLFIFPRPLALLRSLEPSLARLPLGAQYYVIGTKAH